MAPQTSRKPRYFKKIALLIIGLAISAGSLFYVFADVSAERLLASAARISPWSLVLSIVLYWGGLVVLRTALVRSILSAGDGPLTFRRAYRCICIGFLANNVLPFRIGDVTRGMAVARAGQMPFSRVLGGMALERMLDFFMAALIAFGAIMTVPAVPDRIQTTAIIAAIVLGVGFLLLMVLARLRHEEAASGGLWAWLWNLWVRFSSGFRIMSSLRGVLIFLALGLALWGFGVASMVARLASFDLPATVPASLLVFACLGFAVALPSAPGYVGVYQMAVAVALSAIGVEKEVAAAFGLYSWVVDMAVGNVAGAISMSLEGMTIGDLRRAGERLASEGQ